MEEIKRDRGWYAAVPWGQWLSEDIVKSDNVPSMSTLAHIYDNVKNDFPIKAGLSPSVQCVCTETVRDRLCSFAIFNPPNARACASNQRKYHNIS
jgi:hypothetical protein